MKKFINITVLVSLILLIIALVYFIIITNSNLKDTNAMLNEKINTYLEKQNRNKYTFENDTLKLYQIKKKDFDEIKEHINYLSQQVDNTCKLSQDILEKDIDRLNTYMAFGIGFLALFGIFAPFFINLMFKSEIESDIKESKDAIKDVDAIKSQINDFNDIKEPIKQIIKDFPSLNTEFPKLKSEFDEKSPKISLLILQNQISRLYNVSKLDLTRIHRYEYFADVFQNILNSFNECEKNLIQSDEQFKIIIGDFHNNLVSNKLRYYIFEKEKQFIITDFCDSLVTIYKNNHKSFKEKISIAISNLEKIVNYLKNSNANANNKTQSTTQKS